MDREEINQQDGLKLVADTVGAGTYLGNADVVDQLVRDFLLGCVSLLTEVQIGDVPGGDASDKLVTMAKKYAAIFMGEAPGYVPQPWNSPNRLGLYLRAMRPPHLEDYDRPADAYFAAIGTAAIQHAQAVDDGTITEAEARAGLTSIRNDAVAALLGTRAGASRLK